MRDPIVRPVEDWSVRWEGPANILAISATEIEREGAEVAEIEREGAEELIIVMFGRGSMCVLFAC